MANSYLVTADVRNLIEVSQFETISSRKTEAINPHCMQSR